VPFKASDVLLGEPSSARKRCLSDAAQEEERNASEKQNDLTTYLRSKRGSLRFEPSPQPTMGTAKQVEHPTNMNPFLAKLAGVDNLESDHIAAVKSITSSSRPKQSSLRRGRAQHPQREPIPAPVEPLGDLTPTAPAQSVQTQKKPFLADQAVQQPQERTIKLVVGGPPKRDQLFSDLATALSRQKQARAYFEASQTDIDNKTTELSELEKRSTGTESHYKS
jgi:hypothetical protein